MESKWCKLAILTLEWDSRMWWCLDKNGRCRNHSEVPLGCVPGVWRTTSSTLLQWCNIYLYLKIYFLSNLALYQLLATLEHKMPLAGEQGNWIALWIPRHVLIRCPLTYKLRYQQFPVGIEPVSKSRKQKGCQTISRRYLTHLILAA